MTDVSMTDVLGLPIERRLQIVQEIWNSIVQAPEDLPLTDEERSELDRRIANAKKNPEAYKSWEEVRSRLLREI